MELIFYLSILLIISVFGVKTYKKVNQKKEFIAFSLLMVLNVTLTIFHISEVTIPTPLDFFTVIFRPAGQFLYSLFS
jgi:hypothetical protein